MLVHCKTPSGWFLTTCKFWISTHSGDAVDKINYQFSTLTGLDGDVSSSYSDLVETIICFVPLRHTEAALEASTKHTFVKVLPMLKKIK